MYAFPRSTQHDLYRIPWLAGVLRDPLGSVTLSRIRYSAVLAAAKSAAFYLLLSLPLVVVWHFLRHFAPVFGVHSITSDFTPCKVDCDSVE
jgi:hypothetical protein